MPRISLNAALFILGIVIGNAWASGGDYPQAIFYHTNNPHDPDRFYAGDIGIILPSLNTRHLTIAYRWFNGATLTVAQAKSLSLSPAETDHLDGPTPKIEAWLKAREALDASRIKLDAYFRGPYYVYEPNCSADAFSHATARLQELTARYGNDRPSLRSWLAAQDAVFSNCAESGALPAPTSPSDPVWLRNEREYQLAAAYYYHHDYTTAEALFQRIAEREERQYSQLASYLAARAAVHQAIALNSGEGGAAQRPAGAIDAYSHAAQRLDQLTSQGTNHSFYHAVVRLRGLLEAAVNPRERALQLADELANKPLAENAWQDLFDYYLLAPDYAPNSAIYSWITNLRSTDHGSALRRATEVWRTSGKSLWLINILVHTTSNRDNIDDALQSADRIPATSPLYVSVNYYRVKALRLRGQIDQARQLAERLSASKALDPSSQNLLAIERAQLAKTAQEFAAYAVRPPVAVEYFGENDIHESIWELWKKDSRLDWREEFVHHDLRYIPPATARLISQLPFATLQEFLDQPWPKHITRKLLTTLWSRALLTGRLDAMNGLAERLEAIFPEQKELLRDFRQSDDPLQRRFLATLMLLHYPDMDLMLSGGLERDFPPQIIGTYGKRWWDSKEICETIVGTTSDEESDVCRPNATPSLTLPPFVDTTRRRSALTEVTALLNAPAVSTYSGKVVIEYARRHPADPYVAEALHLVVRASRYGTTDEHSSRYSRQAFAMLHKQYASTEWSRRTPHWY